MLRVYSCIVSDHDLRLVALAALICALASLGAVSLLRHVELSTGLMRRAWLGVAAVTTGFGIWATHFIAMLAFQPPLPSGYATWLTVGSLVAAIVLTGGGLSIATGWRRPGGRWLGGAAVGGGIAAMHYMGMAAFQIAGRIVWDETLVVASIALGGLLGSAALPLALYRDSVKWRLCGALVLTLAICSLHFTAMAAATIYPDPRILVPDAALPGTWMARAVALASTTVLVLALAGLAIDLRDLRRAGEIGRMREISDAAVEGLAICDGLKIVTANRSFAALAGCDPEHMADSAVTLFLPLLTQAMLEQADEKPIETCLEARNGAAVPVEVIARRITYAGQPRHVVAVRDISERKKAQRAIHFLAHHDPLTGLPNRASFDKRLDEVLASHREGDRHFAILFVDLDHFKDVNDLFGHSAGDAMLQSVADSITGVLHDGAMASRIGGDEFAVILPDMIDPAEARDLAEAILTSVRAIAERVPGGSSVGTSIGVAVFPNDGDDRVTLLSHADAALYGAKAGGRDTIRLFEAMMGDALRDRRQLQHDLRQAVGTSQLELVYQPQVDLRSTRTTGFEALLRWTHPVHGEISPKTFVPLAEDCGAILELGDWVLRQACADAATWSRPLSVAVNVSASQIHNSDLSALVAQVLRETGLDPARLELEVTETALIRDIGRALAPLRQLKALGVRVAMDDFGTGYSSLSNLRAFPFDRIKIDQSFVRAVDQSEEAGAIVRSVVGLARGLGISVLAEGVETEEERNFLRFEGCHSAQGYLFGRPGPIDDYLTMDGAAGGMRRIAPEKGSGRAGRGRRAA